MSILYSHARRQCQLDNLSKTPCLWQHKNPGLTAVFFRASRRKQIELGFTEPYFLNRELAAGFDLYRTRLDFIRESSYNIDTSGINLRMGYTIKEELKHSIVYSFRQNDISDVQPGASRFILDQAGNTIRQ